MMRVKRLKAMRKEQNKKLLYYLFRVNWQIESQSGFILELPRPKKLKNTKAAAQLKGSSTQNWKLTDILSFLFCGDIHHFATVKGEKFDAFPRSVFQKDFAELIQWDSEVK